MTSNAGDLSNPVLNLEQFGKAFSHAFPAFKEGDPAITRLFQVSIFHYLFIVRYLMKMEIKWLTSEK